MRLLKTMISVNVNFIRVCVLFMCTRFINCADVVKPESLSDILLPPEISQKEAFNTSITPTTTTTTTTIATPKPSESSEFNIATSSCLMPKNPQNGAYIIGDNPVGTFKEKQLVNSSAGLKVICDVNYTSSPDKVISNCIDGDWTPKPPTCSPRLANEQFNSTFPELITNGSTVIATPAPPSDILLPPLLSQPNVTSSPKPGSCVMPNHLEKGDYTIGDTPVGTFNEGTYVDPASALKLICSDFYKPSPPDRGVAFCFNGEWTPKPPTCSFSCAGINSTKSTKVSCTFDGRPLESCLDPVEGTEATMKCESLYEEPSLEKDPSRVCKDGKWDKPAIQCQPSPQLSSNCLIPNNPRNGDYTIGNSPVGTFKTGSSVDPFSVLRVICHQGYKPSPPDRAAVLCADGAWSPNPPRCSISCAGINSTQSTKVSCTLHDRPLPSCKDPVEGTIATITCEPLYEELSLQQRPFRVCRKGYWDENFPQCRPVCGTKRSNLLPAIVGGRKVKMGDYPWHIGIYKAEDKKYLCGGSILNERVVLSAAHCFTDPSTGNQISKENYLIAAGKYYNKYGDTRDLLEQHATIEEIVIPERYKGPVSHYEGDFALVILQNSLSQSPVVQPVCIDWNPYSEYELTSGNRRGIVVGWGRTAEGGEVSEELKELDLPFITYAQCFSELTKSFRQFIAHDKVCAGYVGKGQSACEGDSGGGVASPGQNGRYYIRAIVSLSASTVDGQCNSNDYGLFTLVSKYINFLQPYVI